MTDSHELVIYLLLLRLELHLVWKRLPFATSTYAEMAAERLKTMLRRFYDAEDEPLHIAFLLFSDLYIYDVTWYGELYEKHCAIYSCKGLAFSGNCLYHNVFKDYFLFLSCHRYKIKSSPMGWGCKNIK